MKLEQFQKERVCLIVVDPQEKLMAKIHRAEEVAARCAMVIHCFRELELPVIACTQYEKGLGPYGALVEEAVAGLPRYDKMTFSVMGDESVVAAVAALPETVDLFVLVGVETHVCVYQSALSFLERGKKVWVVTDAVSSTRPELHAEGIAQLRREGVAAGPAEMLLFALLGRAGTPEFKKILPYIVGQG
ncbi:MAG: isochorismatase [Deltaproteobacteria bacterium]|nr:MAG: isochorismatase [Deltaproteobacteria bacterium]